jgi:hypothetical protein
VRCARHTRDRQQADDLVHLEDLDTVVFTTQDERQELPC